MDGEAGGIQGRKGSCLWPCKYPCPPRSSRGCQRPVGPLIRDSREQKRPLFLAGGGFAGSGGSLAIAQRLQRLKPSRCPPSAQGSERRATIGRDDRSRNTTGGTGDGVGARGRAPRGGPESEGQGHPANPRVTNPAPGPLLPPCFIGRPRGGGPPCPGACDPSRGGSDDREWEEWRHPPAALLAVCRVAPGGRVRARGGGDGGVRAPGRPFRG